MTQNTFPFGIWICPIITQQCTAVPVLKCTLNINMYIADSYKFPFFLINHVILFRKLRFKNEFNSKTGLFMNFKSKISFDMFPRLNNTHCTFHCEMPCSYLQHKHFCFTCDCSDQVQAV